MLAARTHAMAKIGPKDGEVHEVQLLADEAGGLLYETGIATITFYKGDFAAASSAVRAQFGAVVEANPWLCGRLVSGKDAAGKAGVRLRHPTVCSEEQVSAMFASRPLAGGVAGASLPAMERGYEAICTEMYKPASQMIVESGLALKDKDKPVCLLTLAESKPGEFCVVFSLSHAVGDGRTYYEVLKMLAPGAAARALPTARVHAFGEAMRDKCNRKALAWVESPAAMCHYMPLMLGCGKKARCYAFELDAAKLAEAKAAGAREGDVAYVTTNDVLTSGFFNACGTRIGMMGLDCRGRLDGVGADLAGNYATALVLDDSAFGTPASLRSMYASSPYPTTTRPLPGCCCAGKVSFGMVSNWSSFAGDLVPLDGCEMVIHLPVKNPASIMWDEMVPFTSGAGKKGVICWTVGTDEAGLRKALPVGACVSQTLFP